MIIKKSSEKKRIIAVIIAAAFIVAAVILSSVFIDVARDKGLLLPDYTVYMKRQIGNSSKGICIELTDKKVVFYKDTEKLFETEEDIKVSDMMYFDVDADGNDELILLCFKRGRYGKHKPIGVEKDEITYSQHIYIYTYDEEKNQVRPIWMASDMGMKIYRFDHLGDEIVIKDVDGYVSRWRWSGFGLKRVDG